MSDSSDAFVHTLKKKVITCWKHGHQGVLTVDFENAFNTLERSEIIC